MLRRYQDVEIDFGQMESGDFLVAPGCIVERKADSDFVASLMDGRLFPQLALMKAEHENVILLIEGSIHSHRSMISDEALHGAMSYLAVLAKVPLVNSRDAADTAALIYRFALHLQHGLGYEIPLRTQKPKGSLSTWQQYLVEGLPGVGPGRAQGLIKHFGGVRGLFAASEAAIAAAPGIGPKTAAKIFEVTQS
jgi:Fanconi anemia group M protein